jgi:hypothetical protein
MTTDEAREREVRAARNQSLFRVVNEQVRSLNEAFATVMHTFEIACECADTSCAASIEIEPGAYAVVRESPRRFIVRRDHVVPGLDSVVDEGEGYVVVEKTGAGGEEAELLDSPG